MSLRVQVYMCKTATRSRQILPTVLKGNLGGLSGCNCLPSKCLTALANAARPNRSRRSSSCSCTVLHRKEGAGSCYVLDLFLYLKRSKKRHRPLEVVSEEHPLCFVPFNKLNQKDLFSFSNAETF